MNRRGSERNYGCRVTENLTYHGLRVIVIQNEVIRISILIDKGTDIFEFLYKPKDIDFMWRSPNGFRNLQRLLDTSNFYEGFMSSYHGGWQEIFPSASGSSNYKGVETGYHGEVASLKWDYEVIIDTPEVVEVKFITRTMKTPFLLEKRIRLESNKPLVVIEERMGNLGKVPMAYMWGHHPSFGAPFLNEKCRLFLPECEIITQPNEQTVSRFLPSQHFIWPFAVDRNGKKVDLRNIPSINSNYSDMLYARFKKDSWFALVNTDKRVGLGFVWQKEMFPYLWIWQEFGGTTGYPWYGNAYTMALEPFTSLPGNGENGLIEAINNGTVAYVSPKDEVRKEFKVVVFEECTDVRKIDISGEIAFDRELQEGCS